MRTEFARLLKMLRKVHPDGELEVVRKAYRIANEAHTSQKRLSGEPYVMHCLQVARNLATLGLDVKTIAAGLLHDVIEDTPIQRKDLVKEFGEEIAALVDGVTKISALHIASSGSEPKADEREAKQAATLRKMLVATIKDVRVLLIKLADRLHNMRTIEYLPPERVRIISRETLDIYAPLAHRLGIARWKWELEDHAFHHLNPAAYKRIASLVALKRREREHWVNDTIAFLEKGLAEAEVNARVVGRPKHLYSIYQKMVQQGKDFDEVKDIQAIRVITRATPECYDVLGLVHQLWPPVPGRFKDYIAMPKANMYQSIHTTVMCEDGMPLEIQIRTEEMDHTAQVGIAAHWLYKETEQPKDRKFEQHLRRLRQSYEWLLETHNPDDLLATVQRDLSPREVFVFTPRGEVKELPVGATPLDFAYMIHSDIGDHCIGARVGGRVVPLRYNLQTGDVVEILTSKNQTPHRDWLDVVVTGRARIRIRSKLREIGELEPAPERGKSEHPIPQHPQKPAPIVRQVDDATRAKLLRVEGAKGLAAQFAKCCNPMPGHAIIGYATKTTGISIHRADCGNFAYGGRDPKRVIEASWDGEGLYEIGMRVRVTSRPNMLADVTHAMRPMSVVITKAEYISDDTGNHFDFCFESSDQSSAERITRTLKTVTGVVEANVLYLREIKR